jgi:cytochrome c556
MATTRTSTVYLAIIAALVAVIAVMTYKLLLAGKTEAAPDGRVAVVLEPPERDLLLQEMRLFLEGLQAMAAGLEKDDLRTVAAAARALGSKMTGDVPPALMTKLPIEFKTLGLSVHRDFDQIALDAEGLGIAKHTLGQVSAVMQKCVACHKTYQLRTELTVASAR